jgi:GDP-D-mannose dehydratase
VTTPYSDERAISLDEASRQLELAAHDAQVAFDCIALGNLDRAHTNALTARAAVDAAETMLRAALGGADLVLATGPAEAVDAQTDEAFEAFGPGADEVFDPEVPDARLPVSEAPKPADW